MPVRSALVVALSVVVACRQETAPDGVPDPTSPSIAREVAEEFHALCAAVRDSDDPYYGERKIRRIAGWLTAAESGSVDATPHAIERETLRLASALIELDRADDAISLLEQTDPELPSAEGTTRLPETFATGADPTADLRSPDVETAPPDLAFSLGGARRTSNAPLAVRRLTLKRNAHLRAGETANCVLHHAPESCILPLRPEGRHVLPDSARRAGDLSRAILAHNPGSVSARWILNLTRMLHGVYPEAVPPGLRLPDDAFTPEADFPWWPDRAGAMGLTAFDLAGGAVMDDFDGDGLLDLVSSTADPCDGIKAFRSAGDGTFEDVADDWGLANQLGGLNLVHADYDGDGRLDLLVLRGGWLGKRGRMRNSLLRNELAETAGRFVDITRAAGLGTDAYPTQTAAFADYDGDGDLDLYIGNEAWRNRPYASQLFRNEGDGTFLDVAREAGVANRRFAKGVAWGDYDDDGDPDLYVSNIGPNRLYRNDGSGGFTDVAESLGVVEPKGRSFATWFFDVDNDGRLDLFVADYNALPEDSMASYFGVEGRSGHPLVYRNTGDGFEEVSRELGLGRPLLPMGGNYGDIDGDGWLDVYLGTGNPDFEALLPNVMLRNVGGTRFDDVSFAMGVAHLQKGHGVSFGDIDNDGDQDLFHQLGGFFPGDKYGNALFENPGSSHGFITLRLEGRTANRFGVGARIEVRVGAKPNARSIHVLAGSGGSFGGSSLQQEIGLGDADAIDELIVRWPGGSEQRFSNVDANRTYRVVQGERDLVPIEVKRLTLGGTGAKAHHASLGNGLRPRR